MIPRRLPRGSPAARALCRAAALPHHGRTAAKGRGGGRGGERNERVWIIFLCVFFPRLLKRLRCAVRRPPARARHAHARPAPPCSGHAARMGPRGNKNAGASAGKPGADGGREGRGRERGRYQGRRRRFPSAARAALGRTPHAARAGRTRRAPLCGGAAGGEGGAEGRGGPGRQGAEPSLTRGRERKKKRHLALAPMSRAPPKRDPRGARAAAPPHSAHAGPAPARSGPRAARPAGVCLFVLCRGGGADCDVGGRRRGPACCYCLPCADPLHPFSSSRSPPPAARRPAALPPCRPPLCRPAPPHARARGCRPMRRRVFQRGRPCLCVPIFWRRPALVRLFERIRCQMQMPALVKLCSASAGAAPLWLRAAAPAGRPPGARRRCGAAGGGSRV